LFRSPRAQVFCLYQRPNEGFAELDLINRFFKQLKIKNAMELTGRLTADAKVSEVKEGKKVVNFSIAINDSYKPKDGERVVLTTYVECAYWINPKVGQYLKKGLLIQMNGRMGSRAWVNRDGDAKSYLTCNISNLKFLGGSTNSTATDQGGNKGKGASEDDDLPF
jgi:single-strand DNA-binding protein